MTPAERVLNDLVQALMRDGMLFGEAVLRARRQQRQAAIRASAWPSKPCEWCGEWYPRHREISDRVWAAQRFCSTFCAGVQKQRGAA